jgi:hypothetical protein
MENIPVPFYGNIYMELGTLGKFPCAMASAVKIVLTFNGQSGQVVRAVAFYEKF